MSLDGDAQLRALAREAGLGPKSARMLHDAGIRSVSALRRKGAVAAFAQVKRARLKPSLNLLWALEAALTGLHWQVVARTHRTSLLLALDTLEQQAAPQPQDRRPATGATSRVSHATTIRHDRYMLPADRAP